MANIEQASDRQLYDALYRLANQDATVICKNGDRHEGKILDVKWDRGSALAPKRSLYFSRDTYPIYILLADIRTIRMS